MAFKAFELNFQFTFGSLDPTVGTIAVLQKENFDEMKDWTNSPFYSYQLEKKKSHHRIIKKHEQVKCVKCGIKNANQRCSNKICKGCCLVHGSVSCKTPKKAVN